MNVIIGTAGHIDSGKTSLVKALTGVDADRLPEEKKRGITIDLGFAELDLGDAKIGFIDVPGHEKFVKNMLAGASGIDAVLLVIAADAGVMPQTREHFQICRLLNIKNGAVVITKTDLVDDELLEIVKLEAQELIENSFLDDAQMIAVSSKNGENIAELKQILRELSLKIPSRNNDLLARLPVDRAFSVKGFGTVVTGTLVSGEIGENDEMELLPLARKVRVRGVQTHGKTANSANAGQRTAVNLSGVEVSEVQRGQILAPFGKLRATQIFDAAIELLEDAPKALKSRARVRLHIGTNEILARVQVISQTNEIAQNDEDFVQFRLETPIVILPNERFIVRSYSPSRTIAGGRVIDAFAVKHRRKDFEFVRSRLTKWLDAEAVSDKTAQLRLTLETVKEFGATLEDLTAKTGWREAVLKTAIAANLEKKAAVQAENRFIARTPFDVLAQKTLDAVKSFHQREPLSKGILRETLREKVFAYLPSEIFRVILQTLENKEQIVSEKDVVRVSSYSQNLAPNDKVLRDRFIEIYLKSGLEVPTLENALGDAISGTKATKEHARKIFQTLLDSGEVVRVTSEFYFNRRTLELLVSRVREFAVNETSDKLIDVNDFKEIAKVSRKYAIPLLEYFDREKITRRESDKRLVL
ncbi:MAG: selenocysteine-specific translation elongation factor [Pyrinomonadaceae bacterium]|nr:selenocysteine-specific translation elongation factor [Pyrinomonadaceae bacterium]